MAYILLQSQLFWCEKTPFLYRSNITPMMVGQPSDVDKEEKETRSYS